MSNLKEAYLESKLSEDDQVLLKASIIYATGELTSAGTELLKQMMLDDYKAKMVAFAKSQTPTTDHEAED